MNDFKLLIENISIVHDHMQQQAVNAVNQALITRNWLIGFYVVEYEQKGKDKSKYGSNLLNELEKHFRNSGIKNMTARRFRDYRLLYLRYPQIRQTLTAKLDENIKWRTLSPILEGNSFPQKTVEVEKERETVPPEKILAKLSFSHLIELLKIEDGLKRTFYEIESIKGTWSVRELKRQISSLYFERSGLSKNPKELSKAIQENISPKSPTDIIKNIYAFEFLDLKIKDVVEESDLETSLLDNLQEFIIELGYGFCLEGRQKKILIGENHYFIDLVFYHRILKCHVLLELKVGSFRHEDIGQLNTYLNYFKEEISEKNDNHPVGILLVADKDHALVKYATAGMDKNLFVQQYLVRLPEKKELEKYIDDELRKIK